jgi:hypothetical protein
VVEPAETRSTVVALLAAAGLRLPDAEVDALVEMYAQLRSAADSLDIPELHDEESALLYAARPPSAPAGAGSA